MLFVCPPSYLESFYNYPNETQRFSCLHLSFQDVNRTANQANVLCDAANVQKRFLLKVFQLKGWFVLKADVWRFCSDDAQTCTLSLVKPLAELHMDEISFISVYSVR